MINHSCMTYFENMDVTSHKILEKVLTKRTSYYVQDYTESNVLAALKKEYIDTEDFAALLSPAALPYLEHMAQKSRETTRRHFGNSVYLFTPIYISNYCENHCLYCGFNKDSTIKRACLNLEQIESELQEIAKSGLEEILILTGESPEKSPINYIAEAVKLAAKYFKNVGLEIYPANVADYKVLRAAGADFITVFQETYQPKTYQKVHLGGNKRSYTYRFNTQERALMAGMRGVAFACLFGLDDFRQDAYATGLHAYYLQKKYSQAEISLSCPRIRPTGQDSGIDFTTVTERDLLQVLLAYRLFLPFTNITISSRESQKFRNNVVGLVATKISASVHTGVGEHSEEQGDTQFEINDNRSVEQVIEALTERNLQAVMNDYVYV